MWAATGSYCGYVCIAPATVGSVVGLLLYLPMGTSPIAIQLGLTGVLFGIGIWAASRAERLLKIKDARPIVIDEIIGMWVAVLFLPYRINYLVGAFLLFRLFDIWKPFPAEQAQRLRGGLGIMVDDVVAALYTNVALHAVQVFHRY